MNSCSGGSTETELGELRARVQRIEEALRRRGVPMEELPATSPAEKPIPVSLIADAPSPSTSTSPVAALESQPAAAPVLSPSVPEAPDRSLESRIGSQWFNRIGILAVLVGMAWFLKLAIDNHWIGPLGRVLIGLVAGAGLIAWSERFRTRGYPAFSYSLKAVGSGSLYLSLWAAFSLYHLLPATAAFAAMIAVTAFNGFMAWIQDAELLALYAIVGGLSTPVILSTGENHETALLSYLLLLDIAVLILVALRPWSRLLFAAFLGTSTIFLAWWIGNDTQAQSMRTTLFLTGFFLVFAFAPRLVQVKADVTEGIHGWDACALLVLPVLNASLGFLGFYTLLDSPDLQWAFPWLAVAFAGFYLLLLRLPARGRLKASPPVLESLHLAAAVVFLTIAIPLKAQGRWLTIGWLTEGAALLWVSARLQSLLLKVLALGCLALGLAALFLENPDASATPIFNQRFATYAVAIAVFAFASWVAANARMPEDPNDGASWTTIAAATVLLMNLLILVAVALEIHGFWWVRHWAGHWHQFPQQRIYAQFSYSAWFMLFGAILLAVGFGRRSAFLRWQGLFLLAVSIGKVFLVDMSTLSQGYRILSFLGLGALLLGVSFVYQRDWLNLRAARHAASGQGTNP